MLPSLNKGIIIIIITVIIIIIIIIIIIVHPYYLASLTLFLFIDLFLKFVSYFYRLKESFRAWESFLHLWGIPELCTGVLKIK